MFIPAEYDVITKRKTLWRVQKMKNNTEKKEVVITGKKMVEILVFIALLAVGIMIFFQYGQNIGEYIRTVFGG